MSVAPLRSYVQRNGTSASDDDGKGESTMRLNPFDTSKIKVRSSRAAGGRGARRAGGVGIGAIIIALVAALVFGIDPSQTLTVLDGAAPATSVTSANTGDMTEEQVCRSGPYAQEACEALTSLNETWEAQFARANIPFQQPVLDLFRDGRVKTDGCGGATSAVGPFYCPADFGIYIDVTFFDQLAQMSGTRGDFARLYVMAHEYGHHVQNLTGLASQVRQAQQRNPQAANQLNVAMELHADCLAGVWAGLNSSLLDQGDLEEGLRAASSVGDDTIARSAGRQIRTENFTHGTSQQRMTALRRGLQSSDPGECNVYFE
ncbi:MAG: neutral zinc metallopeptidase [Pseudomonadota bacterium]